MPGVVFGILTGPVPAVPGKTLFEAVAGPPRDPGRRLVAGIDLELQTHVDLVVTRMRRLLGLTPQSNHWRPWIDGYTEVLVLLEHGDAQAAMARYRRIYAEVRAELESGEAAAQGLEAACPDPL